MPDISVIIPAYCEELSIKSFLERLLKVLKDISFSHEILVIDDGSTDRTARIAAGFEEVTVISHPYNIGNGAAVKTGVRKSTGDILILMDADGQHPPEEIPRLLAGIPEYDMVVGARDRNSVTQWHRDIANQIFNWTASYLTSRKIPDLTSGFRVVKASLFKKFLYLIPNTFSYPTTLTLSLLRDGHSVKYSLISSEKRQGQSKINIFQDGFRFFMIMVKITTLFSPFKIFLPVSLLFFLTGLIYGSYMIIGAGHFSNMVLFLIITGVLVFLMGLIAEQVSMLRAEGGKVWELNSTPSNCPSDIKRQS
ncbi:MAG: glycosyltransferase family 2 protein [bacterium]